MKVRFYVFIFCLFFLFGCDEQELIRQFKEAKPSKTWIVDSVDFKIVSKSYNRMVYLESSDSNLEIFNAAEMPGGDKWTWALVDQARIGKDKKYLFLPIQYCSQLRFNEKQSYYIKVYNIPEGEEKREITVSPELWQELGLPRCS